MAGRWYVLWVTLLNIPIPHQTQLYNIQSAKSVYVDPVKTVDAQISRLFSSMPLRLGHDCHDFSQVHWILIWLPLVVILVSVIELAHLGQVWKS